LYAAYLPLLAFAKELPAAINTGELYQLAWNQQQLARKVN